MNQTRWTDAALRPWSDQDLPLLWRTAGDASMTEHLGGPEPPEKIAWRHELYGTLADSGEGRMFVIVAGPAAESVGRVGYWEREWGGETVWEGGWHVLPEFQGRGLATLGVATAMERAREERRHRSVYAFPAVENLPSNGVCRKVGFELLGEVEFPPGTLRRSNEWRLVL
jgi:RimJ/RimL family protein N-acetyltransferase